MKSEVVQEEVGFWKKTTPCRKTLKISFRKDSPTRRSTSCVQVSWNLANQKSVKSHVAYLTKKTKKSASTPALASARIAPKICQGQLQTICSECPKVRRNPFTSGGVIAERVNVVQTRHKVFPILGEASASSPSKKWQHIPHTNNIVTKHLQPKVALTCMELNTKPLQLSTTGQLAIMTFYFPMVKATEKF